MTTEPLTHITVTPLPKADFSDGAAVWFALALPLWFIAMHIGYALAVR